MSELVARRKTFDPERERGGLVPRYYEVFARKS